MALSQVSARVFGRETLPIPVHKHTLRLPSRNISCAAVQAGRDKKLEALKTGICAAELERDAASQLACTCATRSKHLLSRVQSLQEYALSCVADGKDMEAKTTLQTKQTLRHTLDKNITRAEINYALAAKLTSILAMLQMEMSGLMAADPSQSLQATSPPQLPLPPTTSEAPSTASNNIVTFPLDTDTRHGSPDHRHTLLPDFTSASHPQAEAESGTTTAIRQLVSTAVAQRYVLTDEQLESTLALLERQLKAKKSKVMA